jgi:hypothetical protein
MVFADPCLPSLYLGGLREYGSKHHDKVASRSGSVVFSMLADISTATTHIVNFGNTYRQKSDRMAMYGMAGGDTNL